MKPVAPLLAALRCWVQGRRIYLEINARRSVSFPASKYNALALAAQAELEQIELYDGGRYLRWAHLDEQICVDDAANNRFVHTPKTVAG
ncbi:MAG: DUF2442 domain-containing protein [Opitutae bacterium]|nr:DUF2442 domain-containing protein [Opitutae bacterium]